MDYQFRPIDVWPRKQTPVANRKAKPFQAGMNQTWSDLEHELRHLKAESPVVLQVAIGEEHIRLDGKIRSTAPQPAHPGVIVAFFGRVGGQRVPLKFLCDDCRTWQDNLRAIALTLERLRLADLYGVTKSGEQYVGWKQLPGGDAPVAPVAADKMPLDLAARIVASAAGVGKADVLNKGQWRDVYLAGAKHRHPDSGVAHSHEAWNEFAAAAAVVRQHHGL